jgi:hypothetical protein
MFGHAGWLAYKSDNQILLFLDKELLNGKGILKIAQIIVNSYT